MKRILICGMLLALATSLSFAQRSRAGGPATGVGTTMGHIGPTARMPVTGPISPNTGVRPYTLDTGRAASNAADTHVKAPSSGTTSVGSVTSDRVNSNATTPGPDMGKPANGTGVGAHTGTAPDRVTIPDANGVSDHTRINPNQ